MRDIHVIVGLYWGGKAVYEAVSGSVRYNRPSVVAQRFPISLNYDRLQRVFSRGRPTQWRGGFTPLVKNYIVYIR